MPNTQCSSRTVSRGDNEHVNRRSRRVDSKLLLKKRNILILGNGETNDKDYNERKDKWNRPNV